MFTARGFFGTVLAIALGATIGAFLLVSPWPPAALYGAGFLAGALALRTYQEVRHFGQVKQLQFLLWQNRKLREQVEQHISSSAVARQHGGGADSQTERRITSGL